MKQKPNSAFRASSPDALHWSELLNNLNDRMALLRQLQEYKPYSHIDRFMVKQTSRFVNEHPGCFKSTLPEGHITIAAWIVNKAFTHTLLVAEEKKGKWAPCSGHCDGSGDVFDMALRLPLIKLGIITAPIMDAIFDVELRWLSASAIENGHAHYQITALVEAVEPTSLYSDYLGVHRTQWVRIDDITKYQYSPAVVRMAEKTKAFKYAKK